MIFQILCSLFIVTRYKFGRHLESLLPRAFTDFASVDHSTSCCYTMLVSIMLPSYFSFLSTQSGRSALQLFQFTNRLDQYEVLVMSGQMLSKGPSSLRHGSCVKNRTCVNKWNISLTNTRVN